MINAPAVELMFQGRSLIKMATESSLNCPVPDILAAFAISNFMSVVPVSLCRLALLRSQ